MENDLKETSPGVLLFKEFVRNPLALTGAISVFVMTFVVIFAPLITEYEPTDQIVWQHSKPPGYSYPNVTIKNHFKLDQKAKSSIPVMESSFLDIENAVKDEFQIRIVVKTNGKISKIKRGNKFIKSFNTNDYPNVYVLMKNNENGKKLNDITFKVKKPIDKGILKTGERVLLLNIIEKQSIQNYKIKLNDGVVTEIMKGDEKLENLILDGPTINRISNHAGEIKNYHLLGTDELGRDLLARILYGGRISLMVGIIATVVSIIIGVIYGAVSGYLGGKTDQLMMASVDILYAMPFMFLVIILMVSFGTNIFLLFIALGCVQWLTMARIVRGQILSLKEMEFVEAAKMSGSSTLQIIFKHLIPHTIGPIIVYTSLTVPAVILEESFLAFIGLQVQFDGRTLDSWGTLISKGIESLGDNGERSWFLIYPSIAMAVTLFGLNALGDGLRDVLDPKLKKRAN
ncbi:MAG: hypothetical protein COA79_06555 [Planctomycetota bacterium]|nr:MAG: hypothetical protein COA79_06555 [Planctomycetota bacterium]